ncbi:MAG TPA: VacJ family lipoprotein [Gammaproteobacteria bacterium]|nr:VacJ family lipoprotein [Gammaproteobacteria bacterium]
MKQLLATVLLLLIPVCGMTAEPVVLAYAGSTNMVTLASNAGHDIMLADAGDAAAGMADAYDDLPFMDDDDLTTLEVYDPLEKINRGIFWFNDKMYFYVLKPLARGFRYVPEPWRVSLKNFFNNLRAPVTIINATLQGKFADAGNELTRFATNTTLGIGGLFDPSKDHFGIRAKEEDTGQTFGYYGVGPGPYLVLPFLGPSNLRDGIGLLADSRMDLTYYIWGKDKNNYDYITAIAIKMINNVSLDKDTYEGIKRDALDPYLFVRDAYAQYRQNQIDK